MFDVGVSGFLFKNVGVEDLIVVVCVLVVGDGMFVFEVICCVFVWFVIFVFFFDVFYVLCVWEWGESVFIEFFIDWEVDVLVLFVDVCSNVEIV